MAGDKQFNHIALSLMDKKPIVFTALSKKRFYMRMLIVEFVLERGAVPINPFMSFDYFLADTIDRDVVRSANNNLVAISEELWVFGEVSNGVLAEIIQIKKAGKQIRYFAILDDRDFTEIDVKQVEFEDEVVGRRNEIE